ncbi:hypothetical protein [Aeoliella sp.]|uniref:hypothetical protein n=1 Tax=Aeoliella sp. TaxID=2795800 RepID=UPI003CCC2A37
MLAKVFLATWITTSAALAVGPWDDRAIEVDKEAEIKVLKELREARRATVQRSYQLHSLGLSRAGDMAQASAAYFVAASRLAWAEGEYQQSYRLAQLAVKASEYAQSALVQAEERGLSPLTAVLEARVHLAEAKVVLLRYEAVAKERGIKLEPIEPIDESEFPGLLKEELDLTDPPARVRPPRWPRQPAQPQGDGQRTPGANKP